MHLKYRSWWQAALANKLARMVWAMMTKGECYKEPASLHGLTATLVEALAAARSRLSGSHLEEAPTTRVKKVVSLLVQLQPSRSKVFQSAVDIAMHRKTLGRLLMLERRKVIRARVLKHAKLVIGTTSTIDCVVRNLTNIGARVQIANTIHLPPNIGLTLDNGYTIRPCRIAWRSITETGLHFL